MRDYIPEGEVLTPVEQAVVGRTTTRGRDQRADEFIHPDYIPTEESAPVPTWQDLMVQSEKNMRALAEGTEAARRRTVETAAHRLKQWNAGTAVAALDRMPQAERDVYLVVEYASAARSTITSRFPRPAKDTFERVSALL